MRPLKKAVFFLLCLSFIITGGCWDHREIDELAIILGAGIDRTPDGKTELTLELARPAASAAGAAGGTKSGTATGSNPAWTVSGTGEDIFNAQKNIGLQVPRELYWSQSAVTVFGREAALHGIRDFTNFFYRYPEPRETMKVAVTSERAKKILRSHSELEGTASQTLASLLRKRGSLNIEFMGFFKDLYTPGANAVAPRVEIKEQGVTKGPGIEKPQPHSEAVITGMAVFKADKLAGWFDQEETSGLVWLRGKRHRRQDLAIPGLTDKNKGFSFSIIRNSTDIDPVYDGKTIRFYAHIKTEGDIIEQQGLENLDDLETVKKVEERLSEKIADQVNAALEKAQGEYGTDVFGFGKAFHRKYKKEWPKFKKRWDEEFTNAEIYLSVDVKIRNTGTQIGRPKLEKEA